MTAKFPGDTKEPKKTILTGFDNGVFTIKIPNNQQNRQTSISTLKADEQPYWGWLGNKPVKLEYADVASPVHAEELLPTLDVEKIKEEHPTSARLLTAIRFQNDIIQTGNDKTNKILREAHSKMIWLTVILIILTAALVIETAILIK